MVVKSNTPTVGFVGVGTIGAPIAAKILEAGYDLVVFDADPLRTAALEAQGARAAGLAELGEASDIVGVMVRDDDQLTDVTTGSSGLLATCRRGTILAVHSTVLPATVIDIATRADSAGIDVLDVPVAGGVPAAEQGALLALVGGAAAHLDRCRPVLEAFASTIVHVGEVGAAQVAKLVNNFVGLIETLAAFEGLEIARRWGIERETLRRVAGATIGGTAVYEHWDFRAGLAATGPGGDHMRALAAKDLAAALAIADSETAVLGRAALALLRRSTGS